MFSHFIITGVVSMFSHPCSTTLVSPPLQHFMITGVVSI